MKTDVLLVLIFGLTFGVGLGSLTNFGWQFSVFFLILGATLFFYGKSCGSHKVIFTASVFILSVSLGLARVEIESCRYQNVLYPMENSRVVLRGVVDEFPDTRETGVRPVVLSDRVFFEGATTTAKERLLVVSDLYPALHYGDEVELSGVIRKVKNFSKSGEPFDYSAYLSKDGIFHEIVYPKISIISNGNGNIVLQKLFSIRERFSEKLKKSIEEPEASLALGMLIGEKHALPKALTETFKHAGIIHLVVLSGYNISLVGQFFMKIFSFLPLVARTTFGGVGIILFVLLSGGGASAVRAAVMAGIALFGTATGRSYEAGRALFIAAFVMLLENPNLLIFSPSFQLSFLATFGLIYLSPWIAKYFWRIKGKGFKELLSQTLATQITVLPLLIYLSGSVSTVAVLVNLLVLPTVPFAMLGAFVAGALGFASSAIAAPFALLTSLILSYTISISQFFSSLPQSFVSVGFAPAWVMVLAYVAIVFFVIFKKDPEWILKKTENDFNKK